MCIFCLSEKMRCTSHAQTCIWGAAQLKQTTDTCCIAARKSQTKQTFLRCSPYIADKRNEITVNRTILTLVFLLDRQYSRVLSFLVSEIKIFSNFCVLNFVLKLWVATLYYTDIQTECPFLQRTILSVRANVRCIFFITDIN